MTKIRKKYTKEENLEIVRHSLEAKVNIIYLASRYGVSANAIYNWRQQLNVYKDPAFAENGNTVMTDQEKQIAFFKK